MHDATVDGRADAFASPDLTVFCRLDELGLVVTGQRLEPDRAVLACQVVQPDQWCRRCGCEGRPRDTVVRRLAHEPLGWRPTTLEVVVRRYRCSGCGYVWRQDTTAAAEPQATLSRRALRWALERIVVHHLSVARVAEGLAAAWDTANDTVLAEGKRVLIDQEHRFEGVKVVGVDEVDEHVWRHTRRGDRYVTVIIDLTPVRDGTGPARLLDMVEGRSKQAFKTWLADFDFTANPNINPATINELATGDWIRRGDPLCLIGDSGTGKSHLLIALGTAAAEQGYRVRYTLATRLVNELVEAADEKQLTKTINHYGRVDLLVIDELGYMELDRRGAELLFQVLTEREEKNAIAIASNQSFSAWTDTFTDPRLCAAIVDRLTYNATIIETGTNSYRLAHTRARQTL